MPVGLVTIIPARVCINFPTQVLVFTLPHFSCHGSCRSPCWDFFGHSSFHVSANLLARILGCWSSWIVQSPLSDVVRLLIAKLYAFGNARWPWLLLFSIAMFKSWMTMIVAALNCAMDISRSVITELKLANPSALSFFWRAKQSFHLSWTAFFES